MGCGGDRNLFRCDWYFVFRSCFRSALPFAICGRRRVIRNTESIFSRRRFSQMFFGCVVCTHQHMIINTRYVIIHQLMPLSATRGSRRGHIAKIVGKNFETIFIWNVIHFTHFRLCVCFGWETMHSSTRHFNTEQRPFRSAIQDDWKCIELVWPHDRTNKVFILNIKSHSVHISSSIFQQSIFGIYPVDIGSNARPNEHSWQLFDISLSHTHARIRICRFDLQA